MGAKSALAGGLRPSQLIVADAFTYTHLLLMAGVLHGKGE